MRIRITKETPYRKGREKEIKIGEEYEVKRVISVHKGKGYILFVDGRTRIVLPSDCKIITQ